MDAQIKQVYPDSIAQRLGLAPGDKLLALNENRDLEDLFDYQFEVASETRLTLEVAHPDGRVETYHVKKSEEDDLGIEFTSPIFTPIKTCNNACPFCFIDQQPEGLRPTLYVKDDDYRLSYFCNTYITLTNLTRHDRDRIARIRPGPLYVSVHSTVPAIREKLLLNAKAGNIMTELQWLASLDIPFHAQLVINPGLNDGESLTQTLRDLATLRPHCLSVAVVPVGLTAYRADLPDLKTVSESVARDVVARVEAFQSQQDNADFAFPSDEFYVRANLPFPNYDSYADFPQLDDGVGSARLLIQEFFDRESALPQKIYPPRKYMVLTGKLAAMILQPIVQRLNQIDGLYLDLMAVQNQFWGEAVTVAGLITGQDIQQTLSGQDLSGYHSILIPETMLKEGEAVFLDGMSLDGLSTTLGCPIAVVSEPSRATPFLELLFHPEQLVFAGD